jgi:hypothetical protein
MDHTSRRLPASLRTISSRDCYRCQLQRLVRHLIPAAIILSSRPTGGQRLLAHHDRPEPTRRDQSQLWIPGATISDRLHVPPLPPKRFGRRFQFSARHRIDFTTTRIPTRVRQPSRLPPFTLPSHILRPSSCSLPKWPSGPISAIIHPDACPTKRDPGSDVNVQSDTPPTRQHTPVSGQQHVLGGQGSHQDVFEQGRQVGNLPNDQKAQHKATGCRPPVSVSPNIHPQKSAYNQYRS